MQQGNKQANEFNKSTWLVFLRMQINPKLLHKASFASWENNCLVCIIVARLVVEFASGKLQIAKIIRFRE